MMLKNKPKTRSPLKSKPLRYPGQSLDAEIDRVLSDEVITWVMMVILTALFTLMEWLRWAVSGQFYPFIATVATCFVLTISIWKITHARKTLRALRLGRDGERAVGQYLDILSEKGCRVFHDLTSDDRYRVVQLGAQTRPEALVSGNYRYISLPARRSRRTGLRYPGLPGSSGLVASRPPAPSACRR